MLYQRGKQKTWWYKFEFGGRVIHESTKSPSKTVARDAERQRRRELERTWNKIEKRTLPPTFERAAHGWLEGVKPHLAERTKDIYQVALDCHLTPAFGPMLVCDIHANGVASYQARRKAEKASARTVNKELQVLRMVFKRHKLWANLQGDVKFEREPNEAGKAITAEQEAALLKACQSNPLLLTVVTVALNTTLRKNEIRTLRWSQIDFEKQTLTVGQSKTAGSSGRAVPLNQPAFATLLKWAGRFPKSKPEDYVFPACEAAGIEREHPDKERIDPSTPIKSWRTAWRAALKRAGAILAGKPDDKEAPPLRCRFHDLRHTCITKLAESQASEQTIMAIAGHLSRTMLEHYSHIRMAAKRAAVDAIAKPLEPAIIGAGSYQKPYQLPEGEKGAAANSLN
jgi:integrase